VSPRDPNGTGQQRGPITRGARRTEGELVETVLQGQVHDRKGLASRCQVDFSSWHRPLECVKRDQRGSASAEAEKALLFSIKRSIPAEDEGVKNTVPHRS